MLRVGISASANTKVPLLIPMVQRSGNREGSDDVTYRLDCIVITDKDDGLALAGLLEAKER